MKKKFVFRPGNYYRVEIRLEWEENCCSHIWKDGALEEIRGSEFSAVAMVYRHNGFVCGGQCLDNPDVLNAMKKQDANIKKTVLQLEKFAPFAGIATALHGFIGKFRRKILRRLNG